MLNLANYQITEQIYESVNSIIYRGIKNEDNKPVILKMLKQDYPTSTELNRYQQEYEITHTFNSEGIIKVYSIEKYQNTLVIILEDFGGNSLKELMIKYSFTFEEFLHFAIQTAESLGDIHAANIIHKDINPSNIIWEPVTKQVKIIDFGIASRLPRENPILKNPEQLEGTLAYLSPEQTGRINRSIDYRTDLYSLGITFYEMLTGQLPFTSKDTMELVHCHIAKSPTPLKEINPEIPQIISDIVMKLLAKNAEDRYQSAFGLKVDLEKILNLQGLKNCERFKLAQHDFSGHFRIPQKLYGRENEINILLQAFARVSLGTAEMILIAGYSGVGKTAIVNEVHKPMTEKRGYFATGKFDQYQRNIPYSALTQAFNEFCNYLLTESTEKLKYWQEKILNAVGSNGQVLIEVIPNLELVIGKQPAATQVGITEAQNRFNLVFENFFHTIGQQNHPLVLFIDDLQWADSASLNLLKRLMTDTNDKYFLIIGAYRDNEIDSTHLLMDLPANTTIKVQNLSFTDVNHLITEAVKSTDTGQLTDLVYAKTQGNAFFIHEFLKSLYDEGLLNFDVKEQKWQWDIDKIAAKDMTNNVVELMVNKIEKLPIDTIGILKLAACIGNQFSLETLSTIYQHSHSDTLTSLWKAIEENLVLSLDDDYRQSTEYFKFQHDRIQQAAYSLIGDLQKSQLHLQIGRLLLNNTDQIFEIADHLNLGIQLINSQPERNEIANINLQAGKKALAATAYEAATNYLQVGINLLAENSWQTKYELTLKLYVEATQAEYLNTNFAQTEKLINIILQQANTMLDKLKAYEIQIQLYMAKNQIRTALDTALKVLKMLDVTLEIKPPKQLSIKDCYTLPEMTAPDKLATMQILNFSISPAYTVAPKIFPQIVFTIVKLSAKYGNSALSIFGYSTYGLLLCAVLEDIESGYQAGQLAINLLDRFNAKELKAKGFAAYYVSIYHWKKPARETIAPLIEGSQSGLETGDIEFAGVTAMHCSSYIFWVGEHLETVAKQQQQFKIVLQKLKQEYQLVYLNIWQQTVFNLQELNSNSYNLIEEAFNEMLPKVIETNFGMAVFGIYLSKTMLYYLFGDFDKSLDNAILAKEYEQANVGIMVVPIHNFYYSLALLATDSTDILNQVESNQKKMQLWAFHAPTNYQHRYQLIEAEKNRVLGKILAAEEFYEQAIVNAKENKYLQEEALAYELAGKFYLQRGMEKIFQTYLKEAYYRYQQWGATAKVIDLEIKYPLLITVQQHSNPLETTIYSSKTRVSNRTQTSTIFDLNSVTKASQTITSEIVLSTLLEKIMHIMIENAGAERGLLVLQQGDCWVIEAEGSLNSQEVTILQSLPLANNIAISIINYVVRTNEPVVLANAKQEGIYTEDSYIKQQQLQSILCSPILHQGKLIGVLYLENNLMEGAFTEARLKMVDMLSSQAAISLENALLYRTLEEKVKQRTAQLAIANQEITLLNERLKEENVRMSAELDIAKQLQQMVLPKDTELQQIDSLDISGFMQPADEVGGDYYDVLNHDGHIKIGIGDVTGHGLESGVLMLMVQTTVRALLLAKIDNPEQFLNIVNRTIYYNAQRMEIDKNLTLSLLDYHAGTVTVTGQHEEILVVRKDGTIERIDTFDLGFMVGLKKDITKFISYQDISLQAGDGIVLYTDGITEAQNMDNEQYDIERLCKIVSNSWSGNAKEIQEAVITDVKDYIGKQKILDDITLLVLKQN
ncbi:MAG TPA: GAF domain-containing protein [Thioploca sp.]|nr:GAF domain-containing protein [Thioploca sp.]